MTYSKVKLKSNGNKSFIVLDYFGWENYQTDGDPKLYDNIIQYIPPNWIVGFLQCYE
jgi:hypothetical protein